MNNVLLAILALSIVLQIFGICITFVSWSNIDIQEEHFIPKVIFIPVFTSLSWKCDLTLFGKILVVIVDILVMPSHLLCALIAGVCICIRKLCVKDGGEWGDYV